MLPLPSHADGRFLSYTLVLLAQVFKGKLMLATSSVLVGFPKMEEKLRMLETSINNELDVVG